MQATEPNPAASPPLSTWRVYLRALRLLSSERSLAIVLIVSGMALAVIQVVEQQLIGDVVNNLSKGEGAFGIIALWALLLVALAVGLAWKNRRGQRIFSQPGPASTVETATLEMRLDLTTGVMSGLVRRGPFTGRHLASMEKAELLALLADCETHDMASVPLLEAWLDRTHPDWREEAPPSPGKPMTRAEALSVLGLQEGASEADIRAAHRRLMRAAHPDQGGSDWLASRINEARDLLLG
jgi:ABC-type multidrug transport system fused ATPase/permease subunit